MRLAYTLLALPLVIAGCAARPTPSALNTTSDNLNVADAALAGGDPAMALSVAQQMLENEPNNPDALVHEGDAFYALGHIPDAAAAYQRALAVQPRSSVAEVGLGRTLLTTDPKSAQAAFASAVADDPGNAAAYDDLGISLALQGNFGDAIAAYRKALGDQPGLTSAEVNLGLTLALAGQTQEALEYLGPLATGAQATPKIREDYATALVLAGREDDARTVLAVDTPSGNIDDEIAAIRALAANALLDESQQQQAAAADATATASAAPAAPVQAQPLPSAAPVPVAAAAAAAPPPPVAPPPQTVAAAAPPPPAPIAPAPVVAQATPVAPTTPAPTTPAPTAQAPTAADVDTAAAAPPDTMVQLGALNSEDAATREWTKLTNEMPDLFAGKQVMIVPAVVNGHDYFRLRTSGFANRADAQSFCRQVTAKGGTCTPAF